MRRPVMSRGLDDPPLPPIVQLQEHRLSPIETLFPFWDRQSNETVYNVKEKLSTVCTCSIKGDYYLGIPLLGLRFWSMKTFNSFVSIRPACKEQIFNIVHNHMGQVEQKENRRRKVRLWDTSQVNYSNFTWFSSNILLCQIWKSTFLHL